MSSHISPCSVMGVGRTMHHYRFSSHPSMSKLVDKCRLMCSTRSKCLYDHHVLPARPKPVHSHSKRIDLPKAPVCLGRPHGFEVIDRARIKRHKTAQIVHA
eukprot:gb/GEZN01022983.1/.p1 GENE.gb/GEZN01022983.1/~~gb/GEZN01022983.1/.p1  ORF type:complete len:118 (+),score=9.24 gb/GEZN01022983.1/:54-356(+)